MVIDHRRPIWCVLLSFLSHSDDATLWCAFGCAPRVWIQRRLQRQRLALRARPWTSEKSIYDATSLQTCLYYFVCHQVWVNSIVWTTRCLTAFTPSRVSIGAHLGEVSFRQYLDLCLAASRLKQSLPTGVNSHLQRLACYIRAVSAASVEDECETLAWGGFECPHYPDRCAWS